MASDKPKKNDADLASDDELTEDLREWKEWAEKWLVDVEQTKSSNDNSEKL